MAVDILSVAMVKTCSWLADDLTKGQAKHENLHHDQMTRTFYRCQSMKYVYHSYIDIDKNGLRKYEIKVCSC